MASPVIGAVRTRRRSLAVITCALACACGNHPRVGGGDLTTPGRIQQEVTEGGPNPTGRPLAVGNRGNCDLDLAARAFTVDGRPWLSVTPATASVAAGGTTNLTAEFEVVETQLLPGNYVGTIVLEGTCATNGQTARGSPHAISVNLRVTPLVAAIDADDTIAVDVAPLLDEWLTMADNPFHPGRWSHTAVWTGREMWVFGGLGTDSTLGSGGKYDPLTDDWAIMPHGPNMPSARYAHTAVWTGTEMIVWGGLSAASNGDALDTGGRLADTWTPTSTDGAPSPRYGHVAVWTGTEMIVFGGFSWTDRVLGDGARYDPLTDTWRALPSGSNAPSPRTDAYAAWTGEELLVWGGWDESGSFGSIAALGDGARYDPVLDRWRPMASGGPARRGVIQAWTGSRWLLYGGIEDGTQVTSTDGFVYSPSVNAWSAMAGGDPRLLPGEPSVWTGAELVVWGRFLGQRYSPRTDSWSDLSSIGGPADRTGASAVWTGNSMIVYGGNDGDVHADGAIYR